MKTPRRLLCIAAAAALAGCAVGPNFTRPEPPAADRYTAQPLQIEGASTTAGASQHIEPGAELGPEWWRRFGSPALDDIVARALAHNPTVAAAAATLAQAQELADAQAGTLAPQVGATAGIGRQKYGAEFLGTLPKPPPFGYFSVGATVSYALDYTGGAARSVEQQRALAEVQQQQLDAARLAVAGNAVMQALRIASLRAQIATVNAILEQDRENLKLVHVGIRRRLGLAPRHRQRRKPARDRHDAAAAAAPGAERGRARPGHRAGRAARARGAARVRPDRPERCRASCR